MVLRPALRFCLGAGFCASAGGVGVGFGVLALGRGGWGGLEGDEDEDEGITGHAVMWVSRGFETAAARALVLCLCILGLRGGLMDGLMDGWVDGAK